MTTQKKSAVLKQRDIDHARPIFERISALVLLSFSFLGTVAAFHSGDWSALRALELNWGAVGAGILLQGLCTAGEIFYRHRRLSPIYLVALAFDAGPTALGYLPIIKNPLMGIAETIGLTGTPADIFVYLLVLLAALLLAWVPEGRLID